MGQLLFTIQKIQVFRKINTFVAVWITFKTCWSLFYHHFATL